MPSFFYHVRLEACPPSCPTDLAPQHLSSRSDRPFADRDPKTNILAPSATPHQHKSKEKNQDQSEDLTSVTGLETDWRFSRISVDSIDMAPPVPKGGAATKAEFIPIQTTTTDFGYGVVHLYRDEAETPGLASYAAVAGGKEGASAEPDVVPDALTTVAVLAVPSYMTPSDFMGFVGEETRDAVSHFRMIRTGKVNRYMVLMKFREKEAARMFLKDFNGKVFNSMEPENCQVVFIKSVTFDTPSSQSSNKPSSAAFPSITNDPFSPSPPTSPATPSSAFATKPAPPPTPSLVELPTCPVCLERMDETTGLLTILCQHVFHCSCLSKWRDSSCPVCRYTQASLPLYLQSADFQSGSDSSDLEACAVCAATENLWICLICGHVGCGRYDSAHAFDHYKQTSHCYAMDLESQRVWDYVGDGYVHRLIQNKSDGKLVELPNSGRCGEDGEGEEQGREYRDKVENMGLEYTYLLTSQLDSQRLYYEQKVALAADKASAAATACEKAVAENTKIVNELAELRLEHARDRKETIPALEKSQQKAEARAKKFEDLARRMEKSYREESEVSAGLVKKIQWLQERGEEKDARVGKLEEELNEVKDQLRDVMFFVEARSEVEKRDDRDEIEGGYVEVAKETTESKRRKAKGKAKK